MDWRYVPSAALGGDAFTYLRLDPQHDALALLDVCGHGVGAALHGVSAIQALRSRRLGSVDLCDPGAVAAAMNDVFPMEQYGGLFFSLWYGVFDRADRRLVYVSAGHPPALFIDRNDVQSSRVQELRTGGPLIGLMPNARFDVADIAIGHDSDLLVFSDGAFELQRPSGEMLPWSDFVSPGLRGVRSCTGRRVRVPLRPRGRPPRVALRPDQRRAHSR